MPHFTSSIPRAQKARLMVNVCGPPNTFFPARSDEAFLLFTGTQITHEDDAVFNAEFHHQHIFFVQQQNSFAAIRSSTDKHFTGRVDPKIWQLYWEGLKLMWPGRVPINHCPVRFQAWFSRHHQLSSFHFKLDSDWRGASNHDDF